MTKIELYNGKFGFSITLDGETFAERNNSERPIFNSLIGNFKKMPARGESIIIKTKQ